MGEEAWRALEQEEEGEEQEGKGKKSAEARRAAGEADFTEVQFEMPEEASRRTRVKFAREV